MQKPSREFDVAMTYLEVYNEKVMDLIAASSDISDEPIRRGRGQAAVAKNQVTIVDSGSGKCR